nr:hypothetical protein [Tanacetum cinerariifolium]
MSDAEHSTVTYTSISSDDGSSDVGSPGVIVLGYDGLPMMLANPYAYVGAAMQEPPPPDFVLEPVYPKFMPPEDDVLPAEEQPLPTAVLPTVNSPGYITEFDPKEDPKKEDDEDPADYPADIDDDDDEEESSEDGADDEEEDEGKDEEEEKEEHLALADSIPHPHIVPLLGCLSKLRHLHHSRLRQRAAMIRLRAESPSTSHPLPLPPPIVLPHTRVSMVIMRATTLSTYILAPRSETPPLGTPPLLPIPLPTSLPPLLLPSTDCRSNVLDVTLPLQKRLCIAIGPRFEVGEC